MSAFHWSESVVDEPWAVAEHNRSILVTFWASVEVIHRVATKIRRHLKDQCDKRPLFCNSVHISDRKEVPCYTAHQKNCYRGERVGNHTFGGVVFPSNMSGLDYYRHSVFCLQPPGDMDGRKAIFDSIATGCIPVIFIPNLLHIKYPVKKY